MLNQQIPKTKLGFLSLLFLFAVNALLATPRHNANLRSAQDLPQLAHFKNFVVE